MISTGIIGVISKCVFYALVVGASMLNTEVWFLGAEYSLLKFTALRDQNQGTTLINILLNDLNVPGTENKGESRGAWVA